QTQAQIDELRAQIDTLTQERDAALAGVDPNLTAEAQARLDDLTAQVENLTRERDDARAEVEAVRAEFDNTEVQRQMDELRAQIDTLAQERDAALAGADPNLSAEAQARLDDLTAPVETLTRERDEALARVEEVRAEVDNTQTQAQIDELNAQIATLTAERDQALAGVAVTDQNAQFQAQVDDLLLQVDTLTRERDEAIARAEEFRGQIANDVRQVEIDNLTAQVQTLTQERDAALAQADDIEGLRHGLGMVTTVGDVSAAADAGPGFAQVNTTVASVVLDRDNRIIDVNFDVEQTRVQFTVAGELVDLTPGALFRPEDTGFGLRARNNVPQEWFGPLDEFEAWVEGKTLDEINALDPAAAPAEGVVLPVEIRDPDGIVTIEVGDYFQALRRALENAN
ncbi:MAG TPA: hypothetical protein VLA21_00640, partial [Candidatus Limnocylindria bacterium]|nr:hypothetical protein [Candidatus Limnocylindria bacterium]